MRMKFDVTRIPNDETSTPEIGVTVTLENPRLGRGADWIMKWLRQPLYAEVDMTLAGARVRLLDFAAALADAHMEAGEPMPAWLESLNGDDV